MPEHPKFVCAREGHDLPVTYTNMKGTVPWTAWVSCRRCGQLVVFHGEVTKAS